MPFVEESDLLALHKDVEKAQIINDRLLEQVKMKDKELIRSKKHRNVFGLITVLFMLGSIIIASYAFGVSSVIRKVNPNFSSPSETSRNDHVLVSLDSLEVYKSRLQAVQRENEELSVVKEFYLAKELLENDVVYAVQIKSFIDGNVNIASETILNSVVIKDNPFLSYSLGAFKTLKEAQSFRYELIKLGFEDAFVASYKNGKRHKIEDPY